MQIGLILSRKKSKLFQRYKMLRTALHQKTEKLKAEHLQKVKFYENMIQACRNSKLPQAQKHIQK